MCTICRGCRYDRRIRLGLRLRLSECSGFLLQLKDGSFKIGRPDSSLDVQRNMRLEEQAYFDDLFVWEEAEVRLAGIRVRTRT